LLRHDLYDRLGDITVRIEIHAHHARHQREQKRSEDPSLVAAYEVDIILDIEGSSLYTKTFGWLHRFAPFKV